MEQQQNSKNQTGQQNKISPTGNTSVGATQGMPKASQNEKPTQPSSQGQSQSGQAGRENEQADRNNHGFPPDLQMDQNMDQNIDQQMNQHDKSTEVSESQQNPNEKGSSNKGSVNMGQHRTGVQSQQNSNQNK